MTTARRHVSLALAAVLVAALLSVAPGAQSPAQAATTYAQDSATIMAKINRARAVKKLPRLSVSPALTSFAQALAADIPSGVYGDESALMPLPADAITGELPEIRVDRDYLGGNISFPHYGRTRADALADMLLNWTAWRDPGANFAGVGVIQTDTRIWYVLVMAAYPECAPLSLRIATPSIAGTGRVGEVLTARQGSASQKGVAYSYEWRRGATIVGRGNSYVPTASDGGALLTVTAEGAKRCFTSTAVRTSKAKRVTTGTLPIVTGSPVVGGELTVSTGKWNRSGLTFSYQWLRAGAVIVGATGPSYTAGDTDLGRVVTARVTGTASGYRATLVSRSVAPVSLAAVANSEGPSVSGVAAFGSILTASPGSYSPSDSSVSYLWRLDGVSVSSATSSTFEVPHQAVGKRVTVSVTASHSDRAPLTVVSAPTPPIAAQSFTSTPVPIISGYTNVGRVLSAVMPAWSQRASFTYQWYRNGVKMPGAVHQTFKIGPSSKGKKITVQVTGRRAGFVSAVVMSGPVTAG
jgi:hypothetical protein